MTVERRINRQIGEAVNFAAGNLPEGYTVRFDIEHYNYSLTLITPKGEEVTERDELVLYDEIRVLTATAKELHRRSI